MLLSLLLLEVAAAAQSWRSLCATRKAHVRASANPHAVRIRAAPLASLRKADRLALGEEEEECERDARCKAGGAAIGACAAADSTLHWCASSSSSKKFNADMAPLAVGFEFCGILQFWPSGAAAPLALHAQPPLASGTRSEQCEQSRGIHKMALPPTCSMRITLGIQRCMTVQYCRNMNKPNFD